MFTISIVSMKPIKGKKYMPKKCYEKLISDLILGVFVCCDFRRVLTSWRLEIKTQKNEFTVRDVFDKRDNIW